MSFATWPMLLMMNAARRSLSAFLLPLAVWAALPQIEWCARTWAEVSPECFVSCAVASGSCREPVSSEPATASCSAESSCCGTEGATAASSEECAGAGCAPEAGGDSENPRGQGKAWCLRSGTARLAPEASSSLREAAWAGAASIEIAAPRPIDLGLVGEREHPPPSRGEGAPPPIRGPPRS